MNYEDLLQRAIQVRGKYNRLNSEKYGAAWDGNKLMAGFVGDVGDLSKIIMAKSGYRGMNDIDENLKHELSDCLWSVLVIADYYKIDLASQFMTSMDELEARVDKEIVG